MNSTHRQRFHQSEEEAEKAAETMKRVADWVEICRIPNVDTSIETPIGELLEIIDHVNEEPRFINLIEAWLGKD